jgi:hypothetical protein
MTTQSLTKKEQSYISLGASITFLIAVSATRTADRLSGKIFLSDSPILANFYPNDFLPWGLFLFLSLGWISVNFICKAHNKNLRLAVISFLVIMTGIFIKLYFDSKLDGLLVLSNGQAVWASYLRLLIDAWSFAWLLGGVSAFIINVVFPQRFA